MFLLFISRESFRSEVKHTTYTEVNHTICRGNFILIAEAKKQPVYRELIHSPLDMYKDEEKPRTNILL